MGGSDVLVGRDGELGALATLLDATCAGGANLVFVTGEPGIGKTSLLADLARRANERQCLVLEGSAAEFEQELPFGVVIDALDAYVASLDRHAVDRLAADGLDDLADVLPSLRSLRPANAAAATATERFRSYFAVRELLERLAARQPVVVILDDLHWGDLASIELVAHLLRRPPDAQVLLAGGFRTGQAHPLLTGAIDAAERAGKAVRLALGPLRPDAAAALVADADAAARQRLYLQSGGNPFYLLQLARAGGRTDNRARTGDEVPPAVVAAIGQELAALPAAIRSFAEAAAVVGDPFELDLAAAAAGLDEPAALTAVDTLIAADLVRPAAVPRRFHFRHPLVRTGVYSSSAAGSRLAAHARCAAALAAQGAPASTRALHVEQSARRGDSDAIAVLVEAGEATAKRLPATAARWFEAALRLLPENASAEDRVRLLMQRAGALTTAGGLLEARAALVEGLALVPDSDSQTRVRLTAACANVEQQLGRQDEAHARLRTALDEVTDHTSEAGVMLMVALATDGFYRMEYPAMKTWATAALAAATELGDSTMLAVAEAVLAAACSFTGDADEGKVHCREAARLIDAMDDHDLAVHLEAAGHLAAAEMYLEWFDRTATHAARGVAVARAAGRDDVFPTLFPCLGSSLWLLGRLDESIDVLAGAVEAARLSGNAQAIAWSLLNVAVAAQMKGDLEYALRTGKEAVEVAGASGDTFVSAYAAAHYGWVLAERGDAQAAADMMVGGAGGPMLRHIAGGWRANHLQVLGRCWLALGRTADARAAAAEAMAIADQVHLPRTTAMAHKAAAELALYEGRAVEAVAHARVAVEGAVESSSCVDAAMARILVGQALGAAGEPAKAATVLEQAAAELDAFGAHRYRDQAEQELRKLGYRVHRRSQPGRADTGMESLSGRELEVVRLVVDRRTNPEIAADLFLSLKTVETHLRNIFRKLGASSRVEVARMAEPLLSS